MRHKLVISAVDICLGLRKNRLEFACYVQISSGEGGQGGVGKLEATEDFKLCCKTDCPLNVKVIRGEGQQA